MKLFYTKKSICAALVMALLLVFSLWNLFYEGGVLRGLGKDLLRAGSSAEMKARLTEAEEELNDELLFRNGFVEIHGAVQRLLNRREFNNFGIIRDKDGMLYYASVYNEPASEVPAYTEQIVQLRDLAESTGAKFLVMLPPGKVLYGVSNVDLSLPLNDPNGKMDKLLSMLQQRQVDAIDLRLAMQHSGEPLDRLFFKTDNGWTPLAAFYAMQELVDHLNSTCGAGLDPEGYYRDPANYEMQVYPRQLLGSIGREVGRSVTGLDDFTYIRLRDSGEAEFTWINEEDEEWHGSLTESILLESELEKSGVYDSDPNDVYINGAEDRDSIINHQNPDGPRIAVLRDSWFSPVACYMAPMCSRIDMFRSQKPEMVKDFLEQVRQGGYDYVILEVQPYGLTAETFSFFEEVAG